MLTFLHRLTQIESSLARDLRQTPRYEPDDSRAVLWVNDHSPLEVTITDISLGVGVEHPELGNLAVNQLVTLEYARASRRGRVVYRRQCPGTYRVGLEWV